MNITIENMVKENIGQQHVLLQKPVIKMKQRKSITINEDQLSKESIINFENLTLKTLESNIKHSLDELEKLEKVLLEMVYYMVNLSY